MSPFRSFLVVMVVFWLAGLTVQADSPAAKPDDVQPRKDHYGDPLPEGAIARLGTLRFRHQRGYIDGWAISPDGKTVVTGNREERAVCFWDITTGKELKRIEGIISVSSTFYSRSGKFLAVVIYGGARTVLFDATTCKEV